MRKKSGITDRQNNPKDSSLSPKQSRAIACLLTSRTTSEAAKNAQISERTLYTWLLDPYFLAALHAAELVSIDVATRRLITGNAKALDTLEGLIGGAANETVRRQAAMDWLNLSFRFRDIRDIGERVTELEKAVKDANEIQKTA